MIRFAMMLVLLLCHGVVTRAEEVGRFLHEYTGYDHTPFYPGAKYRVHDPTQPQPPRVIPPASDGAMGTKAPADAIVLFAGDSLDQFQDSDWTVEAGTAIVGSDSLFTKQPFGSCQLHVEWRTPTQLGERAGNMGNSGIFFMDRYELQIFDSYSCRIYADGSAGAIYGQTPPLVNVCRRPGEWQSFDVVFNAPVFKDGQVVSPPTITVLQNGVLVQNQTRIKGPTVHQKAPPLVAHPDRVPLRFQGHQCPVAFRNIWIRELGPSP
jgi:hypothetical protein